MAENERDAERLARVETEVISIKEFMIRFEGKLDAWNNTYVPRQEINEMFRSRDKEIDDLKNSKKDSRNLLVSWASVAVALVAVIISILSK